MGKKNVVTPFRTFRFKLYETNSKSRSHFGNAGGVVKVALARLCEKR
jgi:hypothetical protein